MALVTAPVVIRLDQFGIASGNTIVIGDIAFHAAIGGAALPVTSSAEGPPNAAALPAYALTNAYDGNPASVYAGHGAAATSVLLFGFDAAPTIAEIVLTARNDTYAAGNTGQTPNAFRLSRSTDNGTTWTVFGQAAFAAWTTPGQAQTVAVTPPPAVPVDAGPAYTSRSAYTPSGGPVAAAPVPGSIGGGFLDFDGQYKIDANNVIRQTGAFASLFRPDRFVNSHVRVGFNAVANLPGIFLLARAGRDEGGTLNALAGVVSNTSMNLAKFRHNAQTNFAFGATYPALTPGAPYVAELQTFTVNATTTGMVLNLYQADGTTLIASAFYSLVGSEFQSIAGGNGIASYQSDPVNAAAAFTSIAIASSDAGAAGQAWSPGSPLTAITNTSGFVPDGIALTGDALTKGYAVQSAANPAAITQGPTRPPLDAGGVPAIRFSGVFTKAGYAPVSADFSMGVVSGASGAVIGSPPVFTSQPTITGPKTAGALVTINPGTVTGDARFVYIPKRGGAPDGSPARSFRTHGSDVGTSNATATVFAYNASGYASATTVAFGPITALPYSDIASPYARCTYVGNPNGDPQFGPSFNRNLDGHNALFGCKARYYNTFTDFTLPINQWASNAGYTSSVAYNTGDAFVGPNSGIIPLVGVGMSNNYNDPGSVFAAIIAGSNDADIKGIAQKWFAAGYKEVHFRPGYEMNANFMPWRAGPAPAGFIGAFQRIYTLFHAAATEAGAIAFVWWNPCSISDAGLETTSLYPGDAFCDGIATDEYSTIYAVDRTNWTSGNFEQMATDADWVALPGNRRWVWANRAANQYRRDPITLASHPYSWSLPLTIEFAKLHSKPIGICEGGIGSSGQGLVVAPTATNPLQAGDDPEFPKWIREQLDHAVSIGVPVKFHSVWDENVGDGSWKLWDGRKPLASASYLANLGNPALGQIPPNPNIDTGSLTT